MEYRLNDYWDEGRWHTWVSQDELLEYNHVGIWLNDPIPPSTALHAWAQHAQPCSRSARAQRRTLDPERNPPLALFPMCYSTTLDREVRALERHYNKRLLKDTRGAYLHPENESDDGDRSILFSKRTSAFARPYWPVICSDQPEVFVPCRWGFFKQGIAGPKNKPKHGSRTGLRSTR